MNKSFIFFASAITSFLLSSLSLAKEISIYDQPNPTAKVVGKVDLATGIIPIFTPQNSDWMKVADPRNGEVGWIKNSEIKNMGGAVTFTQKIIQDGSQPYTYNHFEFNQGQPMFGQPSPSDRAWQEKLNQWRMEQRDIQESTQRAMMNMMREINNLYMQHRDMFENFGFPIMPGTIPDGQSGPKNVAPIAPGQNVMKPQQKPAPPSALPTDGVKK